MIKSIIFGVFLLLACAALGIAVACCDARTPTQKREEALAKATCGNDVVYAVHRFGAYAEPHCIKVVCYSVQENASYERVQCVNGTR